METAATRTFEADGSSLYAFDHTIAASRGGHVVGIDEAGRGPLAGPVVAAAVVLDLEKEIPGINDSKKIPPGKREALYERILAEARFCATGEASVEEIERVNILQATFLAMRRALDQCALRGALALVDGNRPIPSVDPGRQECVVRGDARSASIAAASIVAKVTRDRIMRRFHERYPMYDFLSNKGYGTAAHRQRIVAHGLCDIHRRSFCMPFISQTALAFHE
ncbi:MAG: ribonuclease HII [Chitinispirillaceae bacterium]|nr:ribonuclease HII [Chitinispirillaceae bacterium]